MTDHQEARNSRYEQARQAFDELDIDERLAFVAKEFFNTVAQAVEMAIDTVQGECASIFCRTTGKTTSSDPVAESEDA